MLTYYFRSVKDDSLKEVAEARSGVWVHVVGPTEDELQTLINTFSLDEDIIEDSKDFYEVPRMEKTAGTTYFFTRYPLTDKQQGNYTSPLLIVMGESFVVTITLNKIEQFDQLLSGKISVHTTQKSQLFIQIINILTNSYDKELLRLRKGVHKDRAQLQNIGIKEIERLVNYETVLNSMIDSLVPTNTWLQQVTGGNYMQLYQEDLEEMEDLVIANNQVVNSARSIMKTVQNIRSAAEAIITSRLNNAFRILTVLTILMTVPLVISSLYGMNVPLPFQDSPYTFYFVVLINLVLLVGLSYFFRRKRWF